MKVAPNERRGRAMKLRQGSSQGGQGKKLGLFFFLFFSSMASILSGCCDLEGIFFPPDSCAPTRSWLCMLSGVLCACGVRHWLVLQELVNTGMRPAAPPHISVLAGATGAQDE